MTWRGRWPGADDGAGPLRVAVETCGLEFFDSAGVRCLVSTCRKARRQGGQLVVVNAGTLRRKAELMALGEYLPVVPGSACLACWRL